MSDIKERANRNLEQALASTGAHDPRTRYREMLRALRESDTDAFQRATKHFEAHLIPTVAGDDSDPLDEWTDFGRLLASLTVAGETVQIDPSGRSAPYSRPVARDHLVLHLPSSPRTAAIAVAIPPVLSSAQAAAHALLVEEAVRLP